MLGQHVDIEVQIRQWTKLITMLRRDAKRSIFLIQYQYFSSLYSIELNKQEGNCLSMNVLYKWSRLTAMHNNKF